MMPEQTPQYDTAPRPTQRRSSLVNGVLTSDYQYYGELAGLTRLVSAPKAPSEGHEACRKTAMAHGLQIGEYLYDFEGEHVYTVPDGVRPLAHEARIAVSGEFTVDDAELLKELGALVRDVHAISGGRALTGPDIERQFALQDFVPAGERMVRLIPGFERTLAFPPQGEELVAYQINQFSDLFRQRFVGASDAFLRGYTRQEK